MTHAMDKSGNVQSDPKTGEKSDAEENIEGQTAEKDPIESVIGAVGRWQIAICFLVALVKVPVAMHQLGFIFLSPHSTFECIDSDDPCDSNCSEHVFNNSIFNNTIVMEWDLVCGRQWMKSATQSVFMFGVLLGNMIFGIFADRFGRRLPLLVAIIVQLSTGMLTARAGDWYSFMAIRFLLALCNGGTMIIAFVITMEMVGAKYRQVFGMLYQIPFIIGHAGLAGIAYATTDSWRKYQLFTSLPTVALLSYFWLVPESPRWLLTMGYKERAIALLEKAAKTNRMNVENVKTKINSINTIKQENSAKGNVLDLFATPKLRKKTLSLIFGWLSCGVCFYGLSQYISDLSGDIFVNVAISAVIQLPGTLTAIPLNQKFGRKKTLIGSYILTGVFLILIAFIPQSWSGMKVGFCLMGMLGISLAFPTVYLYAGEVFPTVLRNTGVGLCTMLSRVGSMIAPFISDFSIHVYWLPPVIFGGMPLIASILTFVLPETQGRVLPNTIEDAENYEMHEIKAEDEKKERCSR